jgi:hypothetical protein
MKKRPGITRPKSNREVETTGGIAAGFAMDIGLAFCAFKNKARI